MAKPDDRICSLLKSVADHFDQEDRFVRLRQLKTWRKLKLLWEGFTRIWYSEVAHDWKVYEDGADAASDDQAYYDKPINVYRAYLESIIAALSITVPAVKCYPDDADNPLDLSTAKVGDKIGKLIYQHNDVPMLWLHALFIMCTEGMVACYHYPEAKEEYGTYPEDVTKDEAVTSYICPNCSYEVNMVDVQAGQCPECKGPIPTDLQPQEETISKLIKTEMKPKTRICLECYGGLYVKVPNYAMKQKDIPYLIFSYETNYVNAVARYPDLKNTSGNTIIGPGRGGVNDPYEQWSRLSPQYKGEYPIDNVTVRNVWLRPASFYYLTKEQCEELLGLYPKGIKLVLINDVVAEVCEECLDDSWTILYNPLSDYIHQQPIGTLLVNVQEITNDLISLVIQTIEHGVTQVFASPAFLDFNKYSQTEVRPGSVYPTIPQSSRSLQEGFFETKTATLSAEVLPFMESIQILGQTVSGAQPSLFGGQLSGSRTASEYSMSRAQALQRLQNVWKMLTIWWKQVFTKAIPLYISEVAYDEKMVEQDEQGNFINVFIRRSEIEGKIGRVELEANENLPITWSQRKDTYMELLKTQNPKVMEALSSPENVKNLVEAIGIDDFIVPGEDDRQKQLEEIRTLIASEPIPTPPTPQDIANALQAGQEPPMISETTSVPIDVDLDNHEIEADTCRTFLISEAGRLLKTDNPPGYKNVLLHMKAHMQQVALTLAAEQAQGQQQPAKPEGTSTPLMENENVATES